MSKSWVDIIVEATSEAESPERFQYWAALSAISAVVRKNVYMDRFYYKLYPNMYVLLLARSGLRKSNPITLAKKLVTEASATRVISGRNSIQAIVKELGKAYSNGNGVVKDASAFFVSGELTAFLVKDPEALGIMTDLYDTFANEPEWKNTLKGSGVDTLKNPCITLLGASNEAHFKKVIPNQDIEGGFIGRSMIVLESEKRTSNDLMDPPQNAPPNPASLSCYLKELAKLTGEFVVTDEAKEMYKAYYRQLETVQHEDRTGTLERLGDSVLKVAMNVCLAHTMDLRITDAHMAEAIDKSLECLDGMRQVTMGSGESELGHATALVLQWLLGKPNNTGTRRQVLSKYWGEFDSLVLDRVIETLVQSGAVEAERVGKEIVYTMNQEAVNAYKRFKREP